MMHFLQMQRKIQINICIDLLQTFVNYKLLFAFEKSELIFTLRYSLQFKDFLRTMYPYLSKSTSSGPKDHGPQEEFFPKHQSYQYYLSSLNISLIITICLCILFSMRSCSLNSGSFDIIFSVIVHRSSQLQIILFVAFDKYLQDG